MKQLLLLSILFIPAASTAYGKEVIKVRAEKPAPPGPVLGPCPDNVCPFMACGMVDGVAHCSPLKVATPPSIGGLKQKKINPNQ